MKAKRTQTTKWEYHVDCKCGITITLEGPEDLFRKCDKWSAPGMGCQGPTRYCCKCPECNEEINVPEYEIRDDIRRRIK